MPKGGAFICAILFCIGSLFLIATGAAETSLRNQPEQAAIANLHRTGAFAVAVLGVVLFLWLMLAGPRWSEVFAGSILAAGVADALLETSGAGAALHTLHAWIAALVTGAGLVLAWTLSPAFPRAPEIVVDHGWPSLRFVTSAAVVLLIVQIELGAGYRHDVLGLIPHLLGAPIVALVVMLAASFVLQQFPAHGSLRPAAITVLIVTSVQIAFGLITLVTGITQTVLTRGSLIMRVGHVVNGSLTLGAMAALAIEVRRKVVRAQQ